MEIVVLILGLTLMLAAIMVDFTVTKSKPEIERSPEWEELWREAMWELDVLDGTVTPNAPTDKPRRRKGLQVEHFRHNPRFHEIPNAIPGYRTFVSNQTGKQYVITDFEGGTSATSSG